MNKPPPRPPWRLIILLLLLIGAMIVIAVTMWPGMRKAHRIARVSWSSIASSSSTRGKALRVVSDWESAAMGAAPTLVD